jgi:hypothetical protein
LCLGKTKKKEKKGGKNEQLKTARPTLQALPRTRKLRILRNQKLICKTKDEGGGLLNDYFK